MLNELQKKIAAFISKNIITPNTLLIGVNTRNNLNDECRKYCRPEDKKGMKIGTGDKIQGLNVIIIVDLPDYFEVAHV